MAGAGSDGQGPAAGGEGAPRSGEKNEVIAQEWMSARTLWLSCRHGAVPAEDRAFLDTWLSGDQPRWSSREDDWFHLNQVAQRLALHLPGPQLALEFRTLVDLARERKLASAAAYAENIRHFPIPAADPVTVQQRALYLALLYDLQAGFVTQRLARRLRRQSAALLTWLGGGALVLTFLMLGVWSWLNGIPAARVAGQFPLLLAVGLLGALGAYFSRITGFRADVARIGFDEVTNAYRWSMLLVHLMVGLIGAMVLFVVIGAGLIKGPAFPDLGALLGDPPGLSWPDLAKLSVWSFLAGFSERLVPDTLARAGR